MSLIFGNYTALAIKPSDWEALASQGIRVETNVRPPVEVRQAYGIKQRNGYVTAAATEYLAFIATHPTRKERWGKLKAIADKYGVRKNAISTRVARNWNP